ncbi:addiction module antidote protein, HigA family [Desulfonatronum sp. SC1]|nr:addiction module antidote protein, HigA family [Desulfonatronum sp. SC1]
MRMHNPPHPGEVLRELCIESLGISVTDAAHALGVSRKTLSAILNGRSGISPEMALRLAKDLKVRNLMRHNQRLMGTPPCCAP